MHAPVPTNPAVVTNETGSEIAVASFSAWLAERRHQEQAGDRVRQAQG